ncbi:integrase catalytic domain-containing protein [Trichonephila inaurata madagascariensis]|uniref:Integrase catalytic domain-containing protein n=1 Tax=Trichonephila inaurata madagascariensis TaxID=2747483 RepID=A0A8X6X083_9ARAC|nr:integrase catalytic domain-containing protein [Trichonephila inaurata madagascariensis]
MLTNGIANPGDLATRGVSSSTLLTSIWLCGPKFLHETFLFQTDSCVPSLNDAVPEDRVGGRLRHANLAYGHRHPILLPKRHILTNIIFRHYHDIFLHAGTQLVQSCFEEQYWIIGSRYVIRHLNRKCIKCCKVRASITNQMTSDLPYFRISPASAFMRCGVDYAGPFQIKIIKGYCDASIAVYGAVVYLRSYCENYTPTTKLLVSKSRVTPLKTISIPRLELCSCLLLSQLINKVANSL